MDRQNAGFLVEHFGFREEMAADGFASLNAMKTGASPRITLAV